MMSKYFKQSEFACKCGCGFDQISLELVEKLDIVREVCGIPIVLSSGCRCPEHNKSIGGVGDSSHLTGLAADIRCFSSQTRWKVVRALYIAGFTRFKLRSNHIHVDIDIEKIQDVLIL